MSVLCSLHTVTFVTHRSGPRCGCRWRWCTCWCLLLFGLARVKMNTSITHFQIWLKKWMFVCCAVTKLSWSCGYTPWHASVKCEKCHLTSSLISSMNWDVFLSLGQLVWSIELLDLISRECNWDCSLNFWLQFHQIDQKGLAFISECICVCVCPHSSHYLQRELKLSTSTLHFDLVGAPYFL